MAIGTQHPDAVSGKPRILHLAETSLLWVAILSILLICALIFTGVVTRGLFSWSLPDAEIIVRDLMIAVVFLPLAFVAAERAHIAVEVFVNFMPANWRPSLNLLASVIGLLVLLPITWGGYTSFISVWQADSYFYGEFELPEWPGKLAFFLGYLTFALRMLHLVYHDAGKVLSGSTTDQTEQEKE